MLPSSLRGAIVVYKIATDLYATIHMERTRMVLSGIIPMDKEPYLKTQKT